MKIGVIVTDSDEEMQAFALKEKKRQTVTSAFCRLPRQQMNQFHSYGFIRSSGFPLVILALFISVRSVHIWFTSRPNNAEFSFVSDGISIGFQLLPCLLCLWFHYLGNRNCFRALSKTFFRGQSTYSVTDKEDEIALDWNEHKLSRAIFSLRSYTPILFSLSAGLEVIMRSSSGRCTSNWVEELWHCNPNTTNDSVAQDAAVLALFYPLLFAIIFRGIDPRINLLSWLLSAGLVCVAIGIYREIQTLNYLIPIAILSLVCIVELDRYAVDSFLDSCAMSPNFEAGDMPRLDQSTSMGPAMSVTSESPAFILPKVVASGKTPTVITDTSTIELLTGSSSERKRSILGDINDLISLGSTKGLDTPKSQKRGSVLETIGLRRQNSSESIGIRRQSSNNIGETAKAMSAKGFMRQLSNATDTEPTKTEEASDAFLELKNMIANVAHDLKTPVSAFMNGLEVATTIISDMEVVHSVMASADVENENLQKMRDDLDALRGSLRGLSNTTHFLLMIINRVIDYNKVSHGIALVSQLETINVKDALKMPIDSIRDLHTTDSRSRVEIILNELSSKISLNIITDKQWLQENMLCLLSNAVKFSVGGTVTVTVSLCRAAETPSVHRTLRQFSRNSSSASNQSLRKMNSIGRVPTSSVIERDSVSLRSSALLEGDEISNRSVSADTEMLLLFQVEDSGIGLTEAAMSKLFEPFSQAQRMTGGTGLGLYSLAKRTLALGGKYGVYNRNPRKGPGSIFWFAIPYVPDEVANSYIDEGMSMKYDRQVVRLDPLPGLAEHALSLGSPMPLGGFSRTSSNATKKRLSSTVITTSRTDASETAIPLVSQRSNRSTESEIVLNCQSAPAAIRVLVVDDSMSILKMTTMMLRRKGYVVSTAENGVLALNVMNSASEGFDIILMDLQMPVMDGLECTRRIREKERMDLFKEPDSIDKDNAQEAEGNAQEVDANAQAIELAPRTEFIVGVSANSDHDTVLQAYEAGVDLFISKPFTMDSFLRAVAKMEARNVQESN